MILPAQQPRTVGRTARAVAAAAFLVLSLIPSPGPLGQTKEWWDYHDEAKKVIENEKATDSQLEGARKSLQQAVKMKDAEGNFPTYNPSVRADYMPYFYLGWVSVRLKRYDDAEKFFKKSDDLGFIKKGAPADLKTRFEKLQPLVKQLKPAGDALDQARRSALAGQCVASPSSASGPRIKDAMARIEAMLASPSDASALKALVDALNGSVGDCVKEIKGAQIARLVGDLQAARDEVAVEGIADLIQPETKKDLDGAVEAGRKAEAEGDEEGLKGATARWKGLLPKVAGDLDRRIGGLSQEADKIAKGNESALNEQNNLGSRLIEEAGKVKALKASGKSGRDLAAVAKSVSDLKSLVATAGGSLAPILQAKRAGLTSAKRDHDTWAASHACEVDAVEAREAANRAGRESDDALKGESGDVMDAAAVKMAAIRPNVESKMKEILPRKEEAAKSYVLEAADLISKIPSASDQERGNTLKRAIEAAVQNKDVCGIDKSMSDLVAFIVPKLKVLEPARNQAIAKNRPALEEGQRLLAGFGGILKPGTVSALRGPVERLASLIKTSYDAPAMDKTGQEVRSLAEKASGEVRGQMVETVRIIKGLVSDPLWAGVTPARRGWLKDNLPAVERAVNDMSNPDLLQRFAREGPRARVEVELARAFKALNEEGDAARAAGTIESLGEGMRSGSAALNYALSYFYWYQGQAASGGDQEGLIQKAQQRFDDGVKLLRVDLATLGGPLFAPRFIEEMSRR